VASAITSSKLSILNSLSVSAQNSRQKLNEVTANTSANPITEEQMIKIFRRHPMQFKLNKNRLIEMNSNSIRKLMQAAQFLSKPMNQSESSALVKFNPQILELIKKDEQTGLPYFTFINGNQEITIYCKNDEFYYKKRNIKEDRKYNNAVELVSNNKDNGDFKLNSVESPNKNAIIKKFESSINKIDTTAKNELIALNTQIDSRWDIISREIPDRNSKLFLKYLTAKSKLEEKMRGPGPKINAKPNNNNLRLEQQSPTTQPIQKNFISKVGNFFSSINLFRKKEPGYTNLN
jgi:hypothetical protein